MNKQECLPSIHSDRGLSRDEQKRTITIGSSRNSQGIKLDSQIQEALDEDVAMIDIDDDDQIGIITDFVLNQREEGAFGNDNSVLEDNDDVMIDDGGYDNVNNNTKVVLIIDTNFILVHLKLLDELIKLNLQNYQIIIPITVIKELDGLKNSNRLSTEFETDKTIGHLARWAIDWLYRQFAQTSYVAGSNSSNAIIRGQKHYEVIDHESRKDDSILDCCIYFKQSAVKDGSAVVVLLSNDKNLCMKALVNDILTISYRKGMTLKLIIEMLSGVCGRVDNSGNNPEAHQQSHQQPHREEEMEIDPQTKDYRTIYKQVTLLVLESVDFCMHQEFGEDIELIGYDKNEITSLKDCVKAIKKYWISVFKSYFSSMKSLNLNSLIVDEPSDETEFDQFINEWVFFLKVVYKNRTKEQKFALNEIVKQWGL